MGRGRGGRNRKPRNSATFRLCPRPGAADPSDRVLVRVDGNQYHVPGLPDDGYNYLAHIREIRPSYSSTGGGGSSAVFLPTRRAARCGLPLSVKVLRSVFSH
ncbi:unnamed protein product [Triticum turgidum subsp. durum]|uniref:Uncharacterized protein n=1 Tax=Triticum turgidum subsp. durum TaxID=4567 RepID=A0A9R1NMD5_TRITD|nr:unnamed protein product [Triticum turgidum subsp. durum]